MECSIRLAVSLSEEDLRAFPGDQLHFRCHHTFSNFFVIIIIVVIITLSSELLLMPVNGTFHLVSADKGQGRQAAATEIWNLRSAQDNSRHQLRPTQDAQLWHWKWNSVQSKDKEVNKMHDNQSNLLMNIRIQAWVYWKRSCNSLKYCDKNLWLGGICRKTNRWGFGGRGKACGQQPTVSSSTEAQPIFLSQTLKLSLDSTFRVY